VSTPHGEVQVSGRITAAPSAIYALGEQAKKEQAKKEQTKKEQTKKEQTATEQTTADQVNSAQANKPSTAAPAIVQNLDMQRLKASLAASNLRVLPAVVLQTDAASEGLLRNWPKPDSGVAKHYGYAFQWFGLCATVLVLYVWLVWLAPRRRAAKLARDAASQTGL
jgi:cytochrome oxidase assembly protein ShyY1